MAGNISVYADQVVGTPLPVDFLNEGVNDNFDAVKEGYGCKIYNSTDQSITNGVATALLCDSETFDDDTMHDASSNTSRITIKEAGRYLITAFAAWGTADGTGQKQFSIYKNGALLITNKQNNPNGTYVEYHNLCGVFVLAVNDYIEMYAYQTSGAPADIEDYFLTVTKYV